MSTFCVCAFNKIECSRTKLLLHTAYKLIGFKLVRVYFSFTELVHWHIKRLKFIMKFSMYALYVRHENWNKNYTHLQSVRLQSTNNDGDGGGHGKRSQSYSHTVATNAFNFVWTRCSCNRIYTKHMHSCLLCVCLCIRAVLWLVVEQSIYDLLAMKK